MVIKTKIITITALTLILTVGTMTAILIRMQSDKMAASKLQDTVFLGDLIERTTESAMKEGNTREVQKIIENIGKNKEILDLRILSPDATILKSVRVSEIVSKDKDFLTSFSENHQTPRLISDTTINYFRSIVNRKECYGCHDKRNRVIGIIQIKQDVSRNFLNFLSFKRLLILSNILIALLVSVILSLLFSRFVMNPLKNLLMTIRDVETGNWQATADAHNRDELGVIGASFNRMIREINNLYRKDLAKERELSKIRVELEHKNRLEELNAELEFKIRELETANRAITCLSSEVKGKNIELEKAVERLKKINDTGWMLTSIIETPELMKFIVETTADLLNAEKATLYLKAADRKPEIIRYRKGTETERPVPSELSPEYSDILIHGKPVLMTGDNAADRPGDSQRTPRVGVPLKMRGRIIGAMLLENGEGGHSFTGADLELLTTLSSHAMVALENAWLYESLKNNYFATIQSLVNALEANDRFTKGHSERVRLLSAELGKHVDLDFKELELLEHASILHDIGKIGIDNFILQKQGRLTAREYSLIKTHPLIGDEILGPIETLEDVRKTIIQHHERYDGQGYPYGLRGDEISLKSKILSVVDTFDAMMTDRPYRKALTVQQVKEELRTNAGTQFDPYVVGAFLDMLSTREDELLSAAGYDALHLSL